MKKRIISLVMVLALVFTMLPIYAIADEGLYAARAENP